MKANNNTLHCPYCGKRAVLRSADYVYGENAVVSHLYVCSGYPECDSFVGVHKDTLVPLGYPFLTLYSIIIGVVKTALLT